MEIANLRKEIKRLETESKNFQLDYDEKCKELNKLQRNLDEIDELREKYITCEQKLNIQIKTNNSMQDKLLQLQSELASRLNTNGSNFISNEASTYENIIDNLKFIIHEQLALRNNNAQGEIDDLKYKVTISHISY